MLALLETIVMDVLAFSPEYLMMFGMHELPRGRKPRFIIIRRPEKAPA
jgi:hypothetical protein